MSDREIYPSVTRIFVDANPDRRAPGRGTTGVTATLERRLSENATGSSGSIRAAGVKKLKVGKQSLAGNPSPSRQCPVTARQRPLPISAGTGQPCDAPPCTRCSSFGVRDAALVELRAWLFPTLDSQIIRARSHRDYLATPCANARYKRKAPR